MAARPEIYCNPAHGQKKKNREYAKLMLARAADKQYAELLREEAARSVMRHSDVHDQLPSAAG
jgi:hypothetical protein